MYPGNVGKYTTIIYVQTFDSSNEMFISHSNSLMYVISSLVAEGLAVWMAMEYAVALQLRQVIFESDLLQLVSAIVEQADISDLHGILAHIYLLFSI